MTALIFTAIFLAAYIGFCVGCVMRVAKQADEMAVITLCPKCGTPTEHYCGMGACVDMCPQCDFHRPGVRS